MPLREHAGSGFDIVPVREWLYSRSDFDIALFRYLNDITEPGYRIFMHLGSALGQKNYFPYFFIALFVIFYFQLKRGRSPVGNDFGRYRNERLQTLLTLALAYFVQGSLIRYLKILFALPRPFVALPSGTVYCDESRLCNLVPSHEYALYDAFSSFPSGHAAFATLIAASLWPLLSGRLRLWAIFYVLWVGASRSALGVHFPSDVLAGITVSLITVTLVNKLLVQRLFKKRSRQR